MRLPPYRDTKRMAKRPDIEPIQLGSKLSLADVDPARKPAGLEDKAARLAALEKLSAKLDTLQEVLYAAHAQKVLVVLQGMDTAGKDGTIRHVFKTIDPLGVRVASFKAPTQAERDHDFLWRVHAQAPGAGEIVIFNRSHYEDVLITRVHGWIDAAECKRRYAQINAFERTLAESGTLFLKCFLHVSKDEQRDRLQARLDDPTKHWKFNPTDLEERELWDDYTRAYEDATSATSTEWAPWYVIPSNSKSSRNLYIARLLVDLLEGLRLQYPEPSIPLDKIKIK
jgi:PPK2 family polyphosphate:nucleotide phosphotransferase